MTDSPPTRRRFGSGARILLAATAIAAAASCSTTDHARTPTTPSGSSTTAPATTTTSPTVLPVPANGDDTQACATGSCEIRVTESVSIPVPATFGFGPLTVASIADGQIRVTGPLFSGRVSGGGGGCTIGLMTASATDPQDYMHLTCPAGATTAIDGMSFMVLAIVDRAAVIRIGTTQ